MKRSGIKVMAKLITLIGSLAYVLLLAVINGSLGNLIGISITVLGALGVAKAMGENIILSYPLLFILLIVLGFLRGGLRYLEQYSNHYIAFKLLAKIRDVIFTKLRILAPAKLEERKKGSLISMLTSDIETIEVFYAHTLSPICIALVVSTLVCVFVALVVSPYMALYILGAYLIIGIVMPLISNKFTKKYGNNYRNSFTSFNGYFLDAIKGSKDIVLHNQENVSKKKVDSYTDKLIVDNNKLKNCSIVFENITNTLVVILNLGLLYLGLYLHFNSDLSIALLIVGLISLMSSYGPVLALSQLPNNLSQTFSSGNRIIDLLEEEPKVYDINDGVNFEFDNLAVKNVSFSYNDEVNAIRDKSLEVKKGEIVGIMGKSGCGKSTMLKLLLRFYKANSGNILYNGIDIEKINTKSLKKNVCMVLQNTYLFSDTIKNNLLMANPSASDEEIIDACKKASIHDLIISLENGYDTVVGEAGVTLSAGETQRIGLARAFLSNASLILLDEPTSNVDAINEGIILKSLALNKKSKAIILVSHRESTMSICNKVYRY